MDIAYLPLPAYHPTAHGERKRVKYLVGQNVTNQYLRRVHARVQRESILSVLRRIETRRIIVGLVNNSSPIRRRLRERSLVYGLRYSGVHVGTVGNLHCGEVGLPDMTEVRAQDAVMSCFRARQDQLSISINLLVNGDFKSANDRS